MASLTLAQASFSAMKNLPLFQQCPTSVQLDCGCSIFLTNDIKIVDMREAEQCMLLGNFKNIWD